MKEALKRYFSQEWTFCQYIYIYINSNVLDVSFLFGIQNILKKGVNMRVSKRKQNFHACLVEGLYGFIGLID